MNMSANLSVSLTENISMKVSEYEHEYELDECEYEKGCKCKYENTCFSSGVLMRWSF